MTLLLLIIHGLLAVALLGAISHQCANVLKSADAPGKGKDRGFVARYRGVDGTLFCRTVAALYLISTLLGAVLYPEYRLDSRYALEEMGLQTWVGLFELKEHFAAIGIALLPLYLHQWLEQGRGTGRTITTLTLGGIVWFNFLVGHVINNYRGLW